MRLILLGTAGGPRPHPRRSAAAQAVIVGERVYVVDCGAGVTHQLVRAGLDLRAIGHVLLTHQHSDHNLDYGNLLYLAWVCGRSEVIHTYGPPPIEEMTRRFLELNEYDLRVRVVDEGRPRLERLLRPHTLTRPGVVFEDERLRVTAALVHHPPVEPSFAFRFDTADRSIVISGDTTPCDGLIELANKADVLVHEVLYEPAIERLQSRVPNAARLREHLLASHTTLDQVGGIATTAGVKMLVLSHLVPADDQVVPDEQWLEGARQYFAGEVIVGRDLLEI